MSINALWDSIRAIAQALQVATIFPAALFVLANYYFWSPIISQGGTKNTPEVAVVLTALTLMVSYTLYAFNFPLIRFLEGYKLKQFGLHAHMLGRKRRQYKELKKRIGNLRDERSKLDNQYDFHNALQSRAVDEHPDNWHITTYELSQLEWEKETDFPSSMDAILPTGLGNIVAAFEDYPRTRYGIEAIALWPRLIPVLKEQDYLDFVTQEKMVFDFLLNTGVVIVFLGLETFYGSLFLSNVGLAITSVLATPLLAYTFYRGLLVAARNWGLTVRVAFDLYRHELHQKLHLKPANSFQREFACWKELSQFMIYATNSPASFDGFLAQTDFLKTTSEAQADT